MKKKTVFKSLVTVAAVSLLLSGCSSEPELNEVFQGPNYIDEVKVEYNFDADTKTIGATAIEVCSLLENNASPDQVEDLVVPKLKPQKMFIVQDYILLTETYYCPASDDPYRD